MDFCYNKIKVCTERLNELVEKKTNERETTAVGIAFFFISDIVNEKEKFFFILYYFEQ
jgi:hypothetical protein